MCKALYTSFAERLARDSKKTEKSSLFNMVDRGNGIEKKHRCRLFLFNIITATSHHGAF